MQTTEIDFKPFCAKEKRRFRITEPWVEKGWRYATNGWVLVRMPSSEADTPTDDGLFPKTSAVVGGFRDDTAVIVPPLESTTRECKNCRGSGRLSKDCEDCEGNGMLECSHCGNDTECDSCRGTGTIKGGGGVCPNCKGIGKLPSYKDVNLGGVWFNGDLVALIQTLPEARFCSPPDPNRQICFVFAGGGQGALMPTTGPRD